MESIRSQDKNLQPWKSTQPLGNVPFNLLFPKSRTSKLLQFAKDRGTATPPPPSSNSLPFKLLLCSLLPFEHVFGMDSLRLFICRSNTESLLLSLIKNCGMMLLELLCDKSRTPRELKLQMDGGISPVNLLCEMKKINVLSGGTRSGQLSKLDRRST